MAGGWQGKLAFRAGKAGAVVVEWLLCVDGLAVDVVWQVRSTCFE